MIENYKNKMMTTGRDIRKRFAIGLLNYGIKHYPDHFRAIVQETALRATKELVNNEMKERGLIHCALCNERFGLRNHNGVHLCKGHYNILSKAEKKEPAKLEVV